MKKFGFTMAEVLITIGIIGRSGFNLTKIKQIISVG